MTANAKTRATTLRAPRAPVETCLVRIYPPGEEMGRKFELVDDLSIGRDATNTVVIDKDSVSRRHASILNRRGEKVIVDLGSTNGTYVNDAIVTETTLRSGD